MFQIEWMGAIEDMRPVTARFRALRERSGLGIEALAKEMGFKGASSLQRYEDPALFKKPYIPVDLAERAASALTGRGNPPISRAEVMALAGVETFIVEQPSEARIGADALKVAEALGVPIKSEDAYAITRELPKLRRLGRVDLSTEEAADAIRAIVGIVTRIRK